MVPARSSTRLSRLLDGLQVAITAVVLFLALRGEVSHALLLASWGLLPMVRAFGSRTYRRRWHDRVVRSREELAECSAGGSRLPWRAALLLIGLPVLVLALANGRKMSSLDNLPTNLMAASVVLEGDTELSEYTRGGVDSGRPSWPGEPPYPITRTKTGVRSVYPAGNLFFAVPVYALAHLAGADITWATTQWRLARWTATLLSVAAVVMFLFIAIQLADSRTALWVSLMFGLGSSTLSTLSQGLFSQTGATFWILVVLLIEFRRVVPSSWAARSPVVSRLLARPRGRHLVLAATALGFLMQANGILGPGRKWNDDPQREGEVLEERVWDWRDPPFLYPWPRLFRG